MRPVRPNRPNQLEAVRGASTSLQIDVQLPAPDVHLAAVRSAPVPAASRAVAALKQTVGYGAMTNRIEDVANTDCYLITGSNTTESHPVLATRIKQNVRDGADLFVFDPRKVGIAEHADQYTRVEPGYDVAWINGLTR